MIWHPHNHAAVMSSAARNRQDAAASASVVSHGQAVGPLPSQPRRLNIITSKVIATSSVPRPRNRK
jgi:hypothetical protein